MRSTGSPWLHGVLAMGIALAILYLAYLLIGSVPYPPDRLAMLLVRSTPGDIATRTIEILGHWGLRVLAVAVHLGALLVGGGVGWYVNRAGSHRIRAIRSVLAGLAFVVGSWLLALTDPQGAPLSGVIAYFAAALASARMLARVPLSTALEPRLRDGQTPLDAIFTSRRRLLVRGLMALAGMGAGALVITRFRRGTPSDVKIVKAHRPFVAPPDDPGFPNAPGITPEITANEDFYNVDINLIKPYVDHEKWNLAIGGLVENPYQLSYFELQNGFEIVEMVHTLTCISNQIGGDLISTAVWRGVRLRDVLERAGLRTGIVDVVFRAAEGYSDSIPLEKALEETTLVVFGMNGEPLPRAHGFPARIIVPGIYGMKNVKWLTEIETTDHDYQGYWMVRGWSDIARVKTQSRIDVPFSGRVSSESVVAGIAWAGDRGVARVEISEDGGSTWRDALLKRELSPRAWRLWARPLDAVKGRKRILVRSTDGNNDVQDGSSTPPHPNGASGYDSIEVEIE